MNNTEKAKRYDAISCVEIEEQCPVCGKNVNINLAEFKALNLKKGLVWDCPSCHSDLYIREFKLGSVDYGK